MWVIYFPAIDLFVLLLEQPHISNVVEMWGTSNGSQLRDIQW